MVRFVKGDSLKLWLYETGIPWRTLGWLSLLSFVLGFLYVARPFSGMIFGYLYGATAVLYPLLMGLLCFVASPRLLGKADKQGGRCFSPALLGASLIGFAIGQFAWTLPLILTQQEPPFPSASYIVSYLFYPFCIAAYLLLPSHNLSPLSRLRILLDSLIIILAIATLCFYFFLGPDLMDDGGTLPAKVIAGIYPTADLILLFCLLLVMLHPGAQTLYPVLVMLGLATILMFANHVAHLSQLLNGAYDQSSLVNLTWLPVLLLITCAAQTISNVVRKGKSSPDLVAGPDMQARQAVSPRRWKMFIAPILVLVFSALILTIWESQHKASFPDQFAILYIGGFLILMLVVLRQLVAVYEVGVLQGSLQRRNRSLRMAHAQLAQLATTDPLTGLPNHRSLVEMLDEGLANAQTTHTTCSLIFIDIDHFKSVNDRYGHPAGDQVLRQFAELGRSCLPPGASMGRWGGEEFVAILPDTDPLAAFNVAEEIRRRVDHHLLVGKQEASVTCSLGVASYPQDASTRDNLLMSADRAMYAAKRLGRNQVRTAQEPLVLALGMSESEAETDEGVEGLTIVESLSAALEARDRYTCQHARRVAALSLKLALMAGLSGPDAYMVSLGALLHDLGKIAVPNEVLLKPGKLSTREHHKMAQHPVIGAQIVARIPNLQTVAAIVRAHHERVDGSGYPDGLRGEEIPLGARIVAVADAYDALTTTRTYRPGRSPIEAIRVLLRGAGSQFDPQVVGLLVRLFSVVPQLSELAVA